MPIEKLYDHLVKPLVVREGPEGLYPEPRIWGGGMEWEDYNGHFSYGFFREPGVCHPMEGAVVHPYDEILVCAGTDFSDLLKLGGDMSIEIGEEREEHIFDATQVMLIPRGIPHGQLRVRKIGSRPIAHLLFGLAPEYEAEIIPEKSRPPKTTGQKYAHLVKLLRSHMDPMKRLDMIREGMPPEEIARREKYIAEQLTAKGRTGTGMGYEALADESGVLRPGGRMGPGNADQLVWLFGEDLNDFDFNFAWGFYSQCGIWHRVAEGHTHPETEALIFVGLNDLDLNYLGAELEFKLGPEWEPHVFNTPTVVIAPGGFVHLPLITRWVDDTYAFMVACLSGMHEAPWVNPEDLD